MNYRRCVLKGLLLAGLVSLTLPARAEAIEKIRVVASFSIIADMVHQIGGDRVQIRTLVGADGDAHAYRPTPGDARDVSKSQLLVMNGLGFEGWMERLIQASNYQGPIVTASDGVLGKEVDEHETEHGAEHKAHSPTAKHAEHAEHEKHDDLSAHDAAHEHHGEDPHAWQSLKNAGLYVDNITTGLIDADPKGAAIYRANADRYLVEIDRVEAEIKSAVALLAPSRRSIVTTHDAFAYFGAAYGITFHAPLGMSTQAEASAGDVARLIRQIRTENITAVFAETITDQRLLNRIVDETDARIGGSLYSDALSEPGGPAATYLEMMRHNIKTMTLALGV